MFGNCKRCIKFKSRRIIVENFDSFFYLQNIINITCKPGFGSDFISANLVHWFWSNFSTNKWANYVHFKIPLIVSPWFCLFFKWNSFNESTIKKLRACHIPFWDISVSCLKCDITYRATDFTGKRCPWDWNGSKGSDDLPVWAFDDEMLLTKYIFGGFWQRILLRHLTVQELSPSC